MMIEKWAAYLAASDFVEAMLLHAARSDFAAGQTGFGHRF